MKPEAVSRGFVDRQLVGVQSHGSPPFPLLSPISVYHAPDHHVARQLPARVTLPIAGLATPVTSAWFHAAPNPLGTGLAHFFVTAGVVVLAYLLYKAVRRVTGQLASAGITLSI